ncbi:dicarboxylate/amino acid:cation symporter [Glacieibacterium megasporae]|uniref:dicarboxylate/amino acid:cation symporter n=1 Tax=Glacieibacterium megasporae TaxID=2835787 RepID=UPI001C1E7CD2|nr:cation:dicarboxylase symporter family transporter [Polymorphobacter megasporae]UAJ08747.1 dicarboxylate/amino acid:cation symporter [Polymorphobacter megasporae]
MNRTLATLAGLIIGIAAGALTIARGWPATDALAAANLVGTLWLDALRMTVLPLVVTLTATGTARAIAAASGGAVIRRAALLGLFLLVVSAAVAMLLGPPLLSAWAPDPASLAALRGAGTPVPGHFAGSGDALLGLVSPNLVAAAAEGAIPPLAIFALLFGVAAARLPPERTRTILDALAQAAEIILVIVGWVLALAPIGVAALGFALGARLGLGAGSALASYVGTQITVTVVLGVAMYALAALAGRVPVVSFARAALEPQAVAASTQSSLAALPAMLAAAGRLAPAGSASAPAAILPLAVALFRLAAPASIVIVTLATAHLTGAHLTPATLATVGGLSILGTLIIAGLPNQTTFFAAYAPALLAANLPIDLLPLFLAVDVIPDIFYTVTNVTADLSVAATSARSERR